jgi:hypothetical protein
MRGQELTSCIGIWCDYSLWDHCRMFVHLCVSELSHCAASAAWLVPSVIPIIQCGWQLANIQP